MEQNEALRLLRSGRDGVREWNLFRGQHGRIPDLEEVDLEGADLRDVNLFEAKLKGADLERADLRGADLRGSDLRKALLVDAKLGRAYLERANLQGCDLRGTSLTSAILKYANLEDAHLEGADLEDANFRGAYLRGAHLGRANLRRTRLDGGDLGGAECMMTAFADTDLSQVRGLEEIVHLGPSSLGIDTLARSKSRIPEVFLRGCGLMPWEILTASLYGNSLTAPQFVEVQYAIFAAWTEGKDMVNGCFISYSWNDAAFADKLRDRLIAEGVNVWLDRHDMIAGTIQDQVWRAIQIHHVVILILSADSTRSDWVENELDMARRKEKAEGRAVLCPVALDDSWKAKLDATEGPGDPSRALWRTLQQKLVIEFSAWKTKAFEGAFEKLVRGLKVNYGPKVAPTSPGAP